jgi:flagellin
VVGDTVTVGTQTYQFVSAITDLSPAYSVLIGAGTGAASEAASLTNLAAAVNGATGAGVTYGLGTAANTSATATLVANPNTGPVNQILFTALTGGTSGNSIVSTTTGGDNTFANALFTGGGAATNDLLSSADATAALTQIDAAVATVAALRGNIGATVNRLQSASNVINNQTQNLTSAENDVTAADIPTVVANLSQYSILEQTGVSALAQANQQQQLVLKLLQ